MRTRWLVCGLHIVVHESCHDVFELRRELLVLHQGIGEGFQPALKCEKLRSCPFIRPPPPPSPPHHTQPCRCFQESTTGQGLAVTVWSHVGGFSATLRPGEVGVLTEPAFFLRPSWL